MTATEKRFYEIRLVTKDVNPESGDEWGEGLILGGSYDAAGNRFGQLEMENTIRIVGSKTWKDPVYPDDDEGFTQTGDAHTIVQSIQTLAEADLREGAWGRWEFGHDGTGRFASEMRQTEKRGLI